MAEPPEPRARVLLYAFHDMGRAVLEALLADGWPVVGLFTHRVEADEDWFRPPEPAARAAGVPVFHPRDPNTPRALAAARALAPDLILSAMYRRLLGPPLLALPRRGALNLHPSLLPRYRGRAPVNWAILNEEPESGLTLHHMAPAADAGDIVAQARLALAPDETALTLHRRLIPLAVALVREWLPRVVAGTAPRTPQDERAATTCRKRTPADGALDWRWPATRCDALVRAVTRPYPGAFGAVDGRVLRVWRTRPTADLPGARPGDARTIAGTRHVQTGRGALALLEWEEDGGG